MAIGSSSPPRLHRKDAQGRRWRGGRRLSCAAGSPRRVEDDPGRADARRVAQPNFWNRQAENTLDRATAMMPRMLYERLDEIGTDFGVICLGRLFPRFQRPHDRGGDHPDAHARGGDRRAGAERRQVFRLLKAYRAEGPAGLISKRRGRRGNRRKPEAVRCAVMAMIREWYWDFGPTLAAEKLREVHTVRASPGSIG